LAFRNYREGGVTTGLCRKSNVNSTKSTRGDRSGKYSPVTPHDPKSQGGGRSKLYTPSNFIPVTIWGDFHIAGAKEKEWQLGLKRDSHRAKIGGNSAQRSGRRLSPKFTRVTCQMNGVVGKRGESRGADVDPFGEELKAALLEGGSHSGRVAPCAWRRFTVPDRTTPRVPGVSKERRQRIFGAWTHGQHLSWRGFKKTGRPAIARPFPNSAAGPMEWAQREACRDAGFIEERACISRHLPEEKGFGSTTLFFD